jgi:hypothetical protein
MKMWFLERKFFAHCKNNKRECFTFKNALFVVFYSISFSVKKVLIILNLGIEKVLIELSLREMLM